MKKINLKSILKKTFKKKKKSLKLDKKSKVKFPKIKIAKKKPGRPRSKKSKTVNLKTKGKIGDSNNVSKGSENLKLSKSQDQKPEIVKIKKQETEKKQFKIKDYVVYPKHGVGQILSVSSKKIGGIEVQCYDIKFEKDKAVGLLPINKQAHLRPLSTVNQVNKSISILKGKPKIKRSMWSRRAQEYEQKITSGKIYDLAEVVRDLNKGDDLMVDQSYSERQLFEKAYERILSEFQIVLNLSYEDIQKKLNKALRRNLENQTQTTSQPSKQVENETANETVEARGDDADIAIEDDNPE